MNSNRENGRIANIFANRKRIAGEISGLSHEEKTEARSFWNTLEEIALTGENRCGKSQETANRAQKYKNKFMIFNEYRSKK
ncbi:MAG: hypothetical protein GY804_12985 [Alphaproteobacteria bacterium]|nr:hypothetical protein [Alphaproteobacteria bacterium]